MFAKIINDQEVKYYQNARYLNKDGSLFEAAALAAGYKPVVYETQPHSLTEPYWREAAAQVRHGWRDLALDVARARVTQLIEDETARVLASRRIVTYDERSYILDDRAVIQLNGLISLGAPEVKWTLADNSSVMLDQAGLRSLAATFATAMQAVYTWQHTQLALVQACESVEDLAAIVTTYQGGEL